MSYLKVRYIEYRFGKIIKYLQLKKIILKSKKEKSVIEQLQRQYSLNENDYDKETLKKK